MLHSPNSAPARTFGAGGGMEGVDEEDARDRSSREGWDRSGHQVMVVVVVVVIVVVAMRFHPT